MDGLEAGLIAWAAAAVTLVMDWILQCVLVLRYGPRQTRDLVIAEFQNKDVARKVREALDLPDRAALAAVQAALNTPPAGLQELRQGLQELQATAKASQGELLALRNTPASTAALEAQVRAAVEAGVKAIPIPQVDVEDFARRLQASLAGKIGKESQEQTRALERAYQEYEKSEQADQDKLRIYEEMVRMGCPEGMAHFAVGRGPAMIRFIISKWGGREGREIMDAATAMYGRGLGP